MESFSANGNAKSHSVGTSLRGSFSRSRGRACIGVLVGAAIVWSGQRGFAQKGQPITGIEEDWQVTFGAPEPGSNGPRINITMAPSSDLTADYAVFEINHQTEPDDVAGGLQVQRWKGKKCIDYRNSRKEGAVRIKNDVITFTLSMQVQNGSLTFGVLNGDSKTWGKFGADGWMSMSMIDERGDLAAYDPKISLRKSRVEIDASHVQRVVRNRIRYYSNGTLVATDSTKQVIDQYAVRN